MRYKCYHNYKLHDKLSINGLRDLDIISFSNMVELGCIIDLFACMPPNTQGIPM